LHRCRGIAVALGRSFDTISVDSALAGVDVCVHSGPKIFLVAVFVVPPGIGDIVELKYCEITVVLFQRQHGICKNRILH
jgi:hypothetical protein